METKTVRIPNISCGHCVKTIEREISGVQGVNNIDVDLASKTATFTWSAPATWEIISNTLEEIGYPAD